MIGFLNQPSGRTGNQLFHYNFLRQISHHLSVPFFHPQLADHLFFENFEKKSLPFFSKFKRKVFFSSKDIIKNSTIEMLARFDEEISHKKTIVLVPPILGEVFFDYLFYAPSNFIKIQNEYTRFSFPKNIVPIGIHFRGGDFLTWDKNAILPFSYYKKAIDCCCAKIKNAPIIFFLCTDDPTFSPIRETITYLQHIKMPFLYQPQNLPVQDLFALSQCHIIISSPSTFALMAAYIGIPNKKLILNQKWLSCSIERNDTFWVNLATKTTPYCSLFMAL